MKTYIAGTTQEIQNPDLSKGYTYPGRIKVGARDVVMEDSEKTYPPNGLRRREDVYEDCLFFHPWEPGEKSGTDPQTSDVESRLTALEDELQAAKILLGVE